MSLKFLVEIWFIYEMSPHWEGKRKRIRIITITFTTKSTMFEDIAGCREAVWSAVRWECMFTPKTSMTRLMVWVVVCPSESETSHSTVTMNTVRCLMSGHQIISGKYVCGNRCKESDPSPTPTEFWWTPNFQTVWMFDWQHIVIVIWQWFILCDWTGFFRVRYLSDFCFLETTHCLIFFSLFQLDRF